MLTGGWSILAGQRGIRSKGVITVTYTKQAEVPVSGDSASLKDKLTQLDEARAAGLLTDEEYAAKRTDILSRF